MCDHYRMDKFLVDDDLSRGLFVEDGESEGDGFHLSRDNIEYIYDYK